MRTETSAADLHWDDLLGRDTQNHGLAMLSRFFQGKRVLITGGAGHIGAALASAILGNRPERLILLDASEHGIYRIEQLLPPPEEARTCVLGSVLDACLVNRVFDEHRPNIVFHCAALKHVPLLEKHPLAAIETNVLGTVRVAQSAAEHDCEQFVLVSTDKAADPVSILGASKRIAELATLAITGGVTCKKAVRLGNVLGSPGSVVPLFAEQIAREQMVTVTHESAERYFMTVDEAVASLCAAASPLRGSGIYVPQIGSPIRVLTLAKYMISCLSKEKDGPEVVITGLRSGDKLSEVMVAQDERVTEICSPNRDGIRLFSVESPVINAERLWELIHELEGALRHAKSDAALRVVSAFVPSYSLSAQSSPLGHG